ncbi:DUF4233 domain-containing protein [Amycolatopsis rubida]|uniref:DUF4233 domain-containing protein n=1 Tax=Amycolatopsis rubida TaxID=112413 RepID=A0A1I5Z1L4_9PSEU|nr:MULTISPECIES: DUF4233 domain-containing protein [Amycolatopsis]MYW89203.1 DUF4233 domain-containing protein [Amycolatopsis rubida]NEC54181.1 DUF4233 domain-containing protein [Amycolatopsis rubida]OAP23598.1 hypothetical protein A4R44_05458 [Amycolatopsis sp. M39]SFQ49997.1 Protein of unknown function [Amycolatopsis rubida]
MSEETPVKRPAKDPMKGFRGVLAGTLIMEAITVALALPVVAKLGGGITSFTGWTVIALAVVLIVLCGMLKHVWAVPVILLLQLAIIGIGVTQPAIAIIGIIFLAAFLWFLWLRRDVARRMAAGTLPSQQQPQA